MIGSLEKVRGLLDNERMRLLKVRDRDIYVIARMAGKTWQMI